MEMTAGNDPLSSAWDFTWVYELAEFAVNMRQLLCHVCTAGTLAEIERRQHAPGFNRRTSFTISVKKKLLILLPYKNMHSNNNNNNNNNNNYYYYYYKILRKQCKFQHSWPHARTHFTILQSACAILLHSAVTSSSTSSVTC